MGVSSGRDTGNGGVWTCCTVATRVAVLTPRFNTSGVDVFYVWLPRSNERKVRGGNAAWWEGCKPLVINANSPQQYVDHPVFGQLKQQAAGLLGGLGLLQVPTQGGGKHGGRKSSSTGVAN